MTVKICDRCKASDEHQSDEEQSNWWQIELMDAEGEWDRDCDLCGKCKEEFDAFLGPIAGGVDKAQPEQADKPN
jgi:hypothetical protein